MNYKLEEMLGYLIGIPAILGMIRFKKIDRAYFPFILLLWVGLANEIIDTIVIDEGYSNAINDNIYGLLESLLIVWFLKNTGLFEKKVNLFYYVYTFFIVSWVVVNLFIFSITKFTSYFNIIYSFSIVLMSINVINRVMIKGKDRLIKNSIFLIAIGFIAFFTYKVLVEIFWVYGLNASKNFRVDVYRIMTYINLIVNLIYAVAVLWIPRKREYTLL